MDMQLSKDKEHLVLENLKFVYYLVNKLGVTPKSSEYEDIISIGTLGLVKAVITFDSSRGISFSTYASRCINNEILMHYRKANKYARDISIDEPISSNSEGEELTLRDTIKHPNSDFAKNLEDKEILIQVVSIILNYLEGKTKLAILYQIGGALQADIAEKLNVSQSYASRIIAKAAKKIREVITWQVHYKEVFSMAIKGDEYRISFTSKDVSNFNKIFATLLQNLANTERMPDFRVICNRERIVIQIPAYQDAFYFIAQIIQEIDDYSLKYVSDKNILPTESTTMQTIEPENKEEQGDSVEENNSGDLVQKFDVISDDVGGTEMELDTYEATEVAITRTMVRESYKSGNVETTSETFDKCSNSEETSEDKVKTENQVKQVRDYMLSMSSFTFKDLKHHFPSMSAYTIRNAVYLAKRKGLITAIERGKYVVNKT